ncbi:MAG: Ig-like domain-containing protein [Planctomycetaceae bacterium]
MFRRSSHAWLRPRRLQISQLEDRLLFDAVPDAAALAAASDATPSPQPSESQSTQTSTQQQVSHELIIIDPRVADADQLLSDLIAGQPNRSFEVRYLNQTEDGVEQITRLLESSTATYDAVHVFSHGQPGQIELGSTRLSSTNLTEYAAEIARWGNSLTADADLLFYGCDVAKSADGVQMLEEISLLSGADVAASTDATGHASRGGDWDLELHTGAIETSVAVSEESQQNWRHVLAPEATMVGLEAFFRGLLAEAGIRDNGTFGAEGAPPSGFHGPRSNTGLFGFISNPQNNNWAEFDGDFFTPGGPEEGFTLQFNGVNYSNNTSGAQEEIQGSVTGVSIGTYGGSPSASVDWTGTVGDVRVDRHFTITENGLFILMQTTITNTGATTVNDVYWMHNVDPDNDQSLHGDYSTTNTIVNQASGPTDKLALVRATQSYNDGSSVSLVAKDERARVTSGGFSNRNATDVWNAIDTTYGVYTYLHNEGDSVTADEAISLAFQLGSLAPGQSISFAYAYNLEADPSAVFDGLDLASNNDPIVDLNSAATSGDTSRDRTVTFTEGDPAIALADPAAEISDSGEGDITLMNLSVTGLADEAAETINIGGTSFTLNADASTTVTVGSTTFSVTYVASTGGFSVINNAGSSTPMPAADLTTLVRSVTYQNTDEAPTGSSRTFSFSVKDSSGKNSTAAVTTLDLVSVNDAPVVTGLDHVTFTESQVNSGPQLVDTTLSVIDVDSPSFAGGSLTIAYDAIDPGSSQDQLSFQNQGTGSGMIGFSGGSVTYEGVVIGTVRAGFDGSNGSSLIIDFTSTASPTAVNALLQQLTYQNTSNTPAATRTIQVELSDGSGGTSATATSQITVTSENDQPVLDVTGTPSYLQNQPAVDIASTVSITDLDDTQLASATVTISSTDRTHDLLTLSPAALSAAALAGITVTGYNPATGELTLSGTASTSDYATVLDGILFSSSSGVNTDRTISFVVNDGANASNIDNVTIAYTTDTTPPGQPTITAISNDTGASSSDGITSDNTLVITGTGEANSTIAIFFNGVLQGTTTADGSGNWSFDHTATTLPDGPYTLTVQSTDAAGNASVLSAPYDILIDTNSGIGPLSQVPAISSISTDTGSSSTDGITSDNTLIFQGTGQPDSSIELFLNGNSIGSVNVDSSGAWSYDYSAIVIPDGTYSLIATQTDLAGNITSSPAFSLTIATSAPAGPTVTTINTNDVTPTITGTWDAAVASILEVTVNGTTYHRDINNPAASDSQLLANPDGTWSLNLDGEPNLPAGQYDVAVTSKDTANNSSSDTTTNELTIDITAPAAALVAPDMISSSDTGLDDTDNLTNETNPTFSGLAGMAEPGSTVTLYVDGQPVGTTTALPDGSYTVTVSPGHALVDGPHSVTVTFMDAAGNESPQSPALDIVIDTTAPTAIAIDSPITPDNVVNAVEQLTLVISGTGAEPTSTVEVTLSDSLGNLIGPINATVNPDGTWSIPPTDISLLVDGPITISTSETDAAGNPNLPVTASFTLDTTPPTAAPTAPDLVDSSDTGPSHTDDLTNDTTPTFSGPAGSGEPGSTVTLYIDGNPVTTATVNPDGSYSITVPPGSELPDGPHNATTTFADTAGNQSDPSPTLNFVVDDTEPNQLAIDSPIMGDGYVNEAESITTVITGTGAEPNSTVLVTLTDTLGNTVGPITATVTPTGTWSISATDISSLDDGPIVVEAIETDFAGNSGSPRTSTFTLDTTAPTAATTAPNMTDPSDTGTSHVDDLTGDNTPTFNAPPGSGEPGSVVTLLVDGVPVGTSIVNPDGSYVVSVDPALPITDGPHSTTVTFTDTAGNVSDPSPALPITIDTTPPSALAIDTPITADNLVNQAEAPALIVTGYGVEPTSSLEVTLADGNGHSVTVTASVNPDGTWSIPATDISGLTDGTITITAIETDSAGNTGNPVTTTFTLDAMVPDAPNTAPDLVSPSDSGLDDTDNLTNETNPTFSGPAGVAEPGSTVTLYVDGLPVGTTTALPDGSYTVTVSPGHALVDGPHSVSVTFMDAAGNESPQSPALDIVIDTAAPTAIAIDAPITPDNVVNAVEQLTLVISGTGAEPTSTVEVTLSDSLGNLIGPINATVNPDGTWSITPTDISSLVDGPITISTSETDAAGNPNVPVTASFTLDTTPPTAAPTAPDLVDSSDTGPSHTDNLTNDTTPTFSGPAGAGEPGSTVTLYIDGNPVTTATVNPDGSYSISVPPGSELPDGPHNATTTFTDTAGNQSNPSPTLNFVVDATPPPPPTITSSFPTQLTGTGEPGTIITVLGPNGDPLLGPDNQPLHTVVNPDGTWTFTGFHPQLTNQDVVTVISTDAAGNSSQTEATLTIFAYDSFQNMSKPPSLTTPLFRPDSEILLSRLMFDLGSNPTISGSARPGTHLVVRLYGVDGSVQAESYINHGRHRKLDRPASSNSAKRRPTNCHRAHLHE